MAVEIQPASLRTASLDEARLPNVTRRLLASGVLCSANSLEYSGKCTATKMRGHTRVERELLITAMGGSGTHTISLEFAKRFGIKLGHE